MADLVPVDGPLRDWPASSTTLDAAWIPTSWARPTTAPAPGPHRPASRAAHGLAFGNGSAQPRRVDRGAEAPLVLAERRRPLEQLELDWTNAVDLRRAGAARLPAPTARASGACRWTRSPRGARGVALERQGRWRPSPGTARTTRSRSSVTTTSRGDVSPSSVASEAGPAGRDGLRVSTGSSRSPTCGGSGRPSTADGGVSVVARRTRFSPQAGSRGRIGPCVARALRLPWRPRDAFGGDDA